MFNSRFTLPYYLISGALFLGLGVFVFFSPPAKLAEWGVPPFAVASFFVFMGSFRLFRAYMIHRRNQAENHN